MKLTIWASALGLSVALAFIATGCVRPEAPNAEADILKVYLEAESQMLRDPEYTNNSIVIYVKEGVDVTKMAPLFDLTDGATMEPLSGSINDFTQPQKYVVTSQDGKWKHEYMVRVIAPKVEPKQTYSFEGFKMIGKDDQKYPVIIELDAEGKELTSWASGNLGGLFTGAKNLEDFYSIPDPHGYKGNAAKLMTKSAGQAGILFQKPIATGNLFLGNFNNNLILADHLGTTEFGVPALGEPVRLEGYYKYQPGKEVTDSKMKVLSDKTDTFDIYAVFFETSDKVKFLDGRNVLTSDQLVSVARIEKKEVTTEWTHFVIPFVMKEGKSVDPEKLKEGKYSVSIIASSSINGATFEGAIGSTLWIDEFTLVMK